jgi:hypothetical protein
LEYTIGDTSRLSPGKRHPLTGIQLLKARLRTSMSQKLLFWSHLRRCQEYSLIHKKILPAPNP